MCHIVQKNSAANKNEEEEDVYLVCICGGEKDGL